MVLFMWRRHGPNQWYCHSFFLSNEEEAKKEEKTLLSLGWEKEKG